MIRRVVAALSVLAAAFLLSTSPTSAHPLGNATVNRATAVTLGPDWIDIASIVDMAEIPAYAAILDIDSNGDEVVQPGEGAAWADATCDAAAAALRVTVDGQPVAIAAADAPLLTFPPGVGGLETLRLVCPLSGEVPPGGAVREVSVTNLADDDRRGWREVTIAAGSGVAIESADVPSASPSALLTAYPQGLLQAPIAVSAGSATYRAAARAGSATPGGGGPATDAASVHLGWGSQTDALVDLLDGGAAPWSWLLAVAVAAGLGAAHAVSPGHGKALIAAYVIGSQGSMRRAAGLGLTVAASHTVGVFVLGAIVLSATELLVPDRVVAWLSVASGVLVVGIGASVARRAWRSRRPELNPPHSHPHGRSHPHGHSHPHDRSGAHGQGQDPGGVSDRPPATREFLTLGLVGGMVPSTSALLVLLVAVATGRLVEGMILIVAFGAGMAAVLGGLAAATALARRGLAESATGHHGSRISRLAGAVPLASAVVIIMVGVVTTVGALGNL
jgi:ABC-type nickel/cobalt efflux system permease component RcnA